LTENKGEFEFYYPLSGVASGCVEMCPSLGRWGDLLARKMHLLLLLTTPKSRIIEANEE